jgi:hypothetical protein
MNRAIGVSMVLFACLPLSAARTTRDLTRITELVARGSCLVVGAR